ncbi:hypothetical protein [Streptomyces sp. NPDC057238]|uniref:hypothetical protein n=1 Tax=unclassified Streptomyces TaxID=2593676 RepID=UPI003639769E
MDDTPATPKGLPVAEGTDGVFCPGVPRTAVAAEREKPVVPKVWRELNESAARLGVTPPPTGRH